jgi:hypothetical protein
MAQQVAWAAGKPEQEHFVLSLEADAAGYSGQLRNAQSFSRRAIASAVMQKRRKEQRATGLKQPCEKLSSATQRSSGTGFGCAGAFDGPRGAVWRGAYTGIYRGCSPGTRNCSKRTYRRTRTSPNRQSLCHAGRHREGEGSLSGLPCGDSDEIHLVLWKDADPEIPIFIAAKAEYAKLK